MLKLSRYARCLTSHLSEQIRYGLCHAMTGEAVGLSEGAHAIVSTMAQEKVGIETCAQPAQVLGFIEQLVHLRLLVPADTDDELALFRHWQLVLPRQGSAVWGEGWLVRMNESQKVFARAEGDLPRCETEAIAPEQTRVLEAAERECRLDEIGLSEGELHRVLDWLTDPVRQLVRLRPPTEYEDVPTCAHNRVHSNLRRSSPHALQEWSHAARQISAGAQWRFDWLEPTISHAFRHPSPAFDGRSYGANFAHQLQCRGVTLDRVLEIGGGTGWFAGEFVAAANTRDYVIVDNSPPLIDAQRRRCASDVRISACLGDARESLPAGSFDAIILNEVLADVEPESVARVLWACRQRLRRGGIVVATEYGRLSGTEPMVNHLDHIERPIDFDALARLATSQGFQVTLQSLGGFMQLRGQVPVLDGQQERILCLHEFCGVPGEQVEMRVMTAEHVHVLQDRSKRTAHVRVSAIDDGAHFGPAWSDFNAMILRLDV